MELLQLPNVANNIIRSTDFDEILFIIVNSTDLDIPKGGELVTGFYDNRVRIIGWSVNLQSSRGVTNEDIKQLASIVKEID